MRLLVGLGNPGPRYAYNRHNIGFMVVEELARTAGFSAWKAGAIKGAETTSGMVGRTKCVLVKPQEFMNLSGFAVQRTMGFHGIEPAMLLVIHDEIDLDFELLDLLVVVRVIVVVGVCALDLDPDVERLDRLAVARPHQFEITDEPTDRGGGQALGTRLVRNGIDAKGQSWPREREGRPFSTSALAFSESWTEAV